MTGTEPMRVLFTSIAHNTHFFSMVPLAWAFRAAGHEVRVASQPAQTAGITGAGLTAVPVGTDHGYHERLQEQARTDGFAPRIDFDNIRDAEPDLHELLGFYTLLVPSFFAAVNNDSMIDDLVDYAREWKPDLVIWEPLTWAGAIAAQVVGAAHARLLWSSDVLGLTRQKFLRALADEPAPAQDDPLREWLTWTLERHGSEFDESVVSGQWTIEQEPPSLRLPTDQHTIPMRYVPYNGRAAIPDWLRAPADRPRVCLTVGVSTRDGIGHSTVSLADLIHAMADLDIELIATLNEDQRAGLDNVPANTRLVDYVPLHALLPGCAAVIHHGGGGTWCTAMRSAVPQLVIPEIWDATLKARWLAELGAGLHQPVSSMTVDSLRDKVIRLVEDPSFQAAANALRAEMLAQPSPAEAVLELERLTEKGRR